MGEKHLIRTLRDATGPPAARVAAARSLGALPRATYAVWQALSAVFQDAREAVEVRSAAAWALGQHNPAAAPNQLCRYLEGDTARQVRREAVAVLAHLGRVPGKMEPMLLRDLQALRVGMALAPLANLASTYGRDPRVLAVLQQALQHPDPQIRATGMRGLGMLGEMAAVVRAMHDEVPQVRRDAAETLGYYSLLSDGELSALHSALHDSDGEARHAAQVALRRLGRLPTPTPPPVSTPLAPATAAGTAPGWLPLLERWSQQWLRVQEYVVELPDEVIASGWLGYPGATEQEAHELEQRLGRTLPPTYRAFLRVSNGWRRTSPFIEQVWSTRDVDYFRTRHQEWIDVLIQAAADVPEERHGRTADDHEVSAFRATSLQEAVQISEVGDAAVYLLIPEVVTPEGEWEAWFLANWLPGALRYPSFWHLMQAEYASFLRLRESSE